MVSEANEPGSESGKRSDDRRGAARGTRAGCWSPQEGGASSHLAARLAPRAPGSFAAAALVYPDSLLGRDRPQHRLGIAEPGGGAGRHDRVDRRQVLGRERDRERARVLLEVRPPLGPRDGDDVLALREHPGERELRGLAALARREPLEVAHEVEILLEVLALEAGREAAVVVGREVLEALDLPGQEAPPERAVGDEADPELATGGDEPVLRVAAPERVLGLHRGDRVHRARAAGRL